MKYTIIVIFIIFVIVHSFYEQEFVVSCSYYVLKGQINMTNTCLNTCFMPLKYIHNSN